MYKPGDPLPPPNAAIICPMTLARRKPVSCKSLHENCPKYVMISFTTESGEANPYIGCADGILPALLVDVSNRMNQLGAATESLRNEVVKPMEVIASIFEQQAQRSSGSSVVRTDEFP